MTFLSSDEPMVNYAVVSGSIERLGMLSRTGFGGWILTFGLRNRIERPAGEGYEGSEKVSVLAVEAWGALAREMSGLLEEGSSVLVEGEMVSRDYEDRTKAVRHRMVIKAWNIQLLDAPA
jgi:single-stranded DNA-binding protein